MAIYYTDSEGAVLTLLPVKRMHQKIAKQLFKNRATNKRPSYVKSPRSSVTVNGKRVFVYSVFFLKGNKVVKVWDARLNGYRPKKYVKNLTVPIGLAVKPN